MVSPGIMRASPQGGDIHVSCRVPLDPVSQE